MRGLYLLGAAAKIGRVPGTPQDLVVTRQGRLHRRGVLLPQPRRTLQIGEHEGDRPGRQLRHCPLLATRNEK
jgi:hypothetical protein